MKFGMYRLGFALLSLVTAALGAPVSMNNDTCNEDGNSLDATNITNGIHVQGTLTLFPSGAEECSSGWTLQRELDLPAGDYNLLVDLDVNSNFEVSTPVSGFQLRALSLNSRIVGSFGVGLVHNFAIGPDSFDDSASLPFTWAGGILTLEQQFGIVVLQPDGQFARLDLDFPGSAVSQITPQAPVPEPSTYAMVLLGAGLVALRRRR